MSISTIISFIKIIPALKSWFDFFIAEYVKLEVEKMKKEHRDAIKYAIENHDQRPLEKAIGSPKSGKHSGHAGTDVVDSLPNVGMRDNKK